MENITYLLIVQDLQEVSISEVWFMAYHQFTDQDFLENRPSKFTYSNLGKIQQVKVMGREILSQNLQKRLQNIGKYDIENANRTK